MRRFAPAIAGFLLVLGLPVAEQELGTLQACADDLRGLDRLRPLREEDLGDRPCGIARLRNAIA